MNALLGSLFFWPATKVASAGENGSEIVFNIQDQASSPIPCRIHLHDESGRPIEPLGYPFWHDHFVCDGSAKVDVAPGQYRWEIERGPEYRRLSGTATVAEKETVTVNATLLRITDLRREGWFSADMHVHRPVSEIKLLMRADDLDFAPVIEWWNKPAPDAQSTEPVEFPFDEHRIYTTVAGEDERQGGALLFFGLRKPLDLSVQSREYPSPMDFVKVAVDQNPRVWIDIEKPFWWDVPAWIASGKMQSIEIANNHMNRSGMLESEAWGRPRDADRLPSPRGNGYWTQEIYYHLLNCGIRIPPSAGSASGVLENPVGYNRVYAYLGSKPFTRDHWFESLRQGHCFVTNGPLLRVEADGQLPGTTLQVGNQPRTIELAVQLTSNDPVSRIEVIHNGTVVQQIPCGKDIDQKMKIALEIEHPGWFLLRAIADVDNTFRFASTAPWYLDGPKGHLSRSSAQFFLDWVDERIEQVRENVSDPTQLQSVLRWHIEARGFWEHKREMANVH